MARFTLDSATEFLFGKDVGSLGANLPYPAGSPLAQDPAILNHPSNVFVRAFMQGQMATAYRSRLGMNWPLKEFWSDKVLPHRRLVDEFVNPILENRKRERLAMTANIEKSGDWEAETLLDHLIDSEYTGQFYAHQGYFHLHLTLYRPKGYQGRASKHFGSRKRHSAMFFSSFPSCLD